MTNSLHSVGEYLSTSGVTTMSRQGTNIAGSQMAFVDTSETTTSTSYTDLATVGPQVTVQVPLSGLILVMVRVEAASSSASGLVYAGFEVQQPTGTVRLGGTTRYAAVVGGTAFQSAVGIGIYNASTYGALPSSNQSAVITMKYITDSATTATFRRRVLIAIPL